MNVRRQKTHSIKSRIATACLLVILLIIGVSLAGYGSLDLIPNGQKDKETAIEALNGEITPFTIDFTQPFIIKLSSDVNFLYNGSDLANGFDLSTLQPFTVFNLLSYQFRIQFNNSKMFVSADIKNSNGTLIGQIVNNTWKTVNPDTLLFWDRNYNAYAFEIIGSNDKPTLQVIMVGPNQIQIGGLFYEKTGGSLYIAPETTGAMLYVNVRPDQHLEENASIITIFKYPCLTNSSNLGKMVSPYYPSSDPLAEPTSRIQLGNELYIGGTIIAVISAALLPFPIASMIRMIWRKPKPKRNVQVIIQNKYYLGNKPKKAKKPKITKKSAEKEEKS